MSIVTVAHCCGMGTGMVVDWLDSSCNFLPRALSRLPSSDKALNWQSNWVVKLPLICNYSLFKEVLL